MRFQATVAFAVLAVSSLCSSVCAQGVANLDRFLGGLELCGENAQFEALRKSVIERFGTDADAKQPKKNRNVRLVLPNELAATMGQPISQLEREYTVVMIPFRGVYQGLRVTSLRFFLGRENGIFGYWVIFDASAQVLRARYANSLATAQEKVSADGVDVSFNVLQREPGTISCDFST